MHYWMAFCRYFFWRRKIVLKHDWRLLFFCLEAATIYIPDCLY